MSDGTLSPHELVVEAADRGVSLLAITDHDTTAALPEAGEAARAAGVVLVPGVELDAESEDYDIHILGYFFNPRHPALEAALKELRETRERRNAAILARLESLGVGVDPERVKAIAGRGFPAGRPHIAAAMVEAGHVASRQQAFRRYLARGRTAFVARTRLGPDNACAVIRAAGGLAVLAHPAKMGLRRAAHQVAVSGVDGIEVFHCDHDEKDVADLLDFARERGLMITGGSDSHGPHSERPLAIGSVPVPDWVGEELMARAPEWWKAQL